MAKVSDNFGGGSFHDHTIRTTVNRLAEAVGEPQNDYNGGDDKVNFEWDCETEDGTLFTIYDWKEYRVLDRDELITFHLGGETGSDTRKAMYEVKSQL